jgi:hypothetical protein
MRRSCTTRRQLERSYFNVDTYAFEGPAIWDGSQYRKLKLDSMPTTPSCRRM